MKSTVLFCSSICAFILNLQIANAALIPGHFYPSVCGENDKYEANLRIIQVVDVCIGSVLTEISAPGSSMPEFEFIPTYTVEYNNGRLDYMTLISKEELPVIMSRAEPYIGDWQGQNILYQVNLQGSDQNIIELILEEDQDNQPVSLKSIEGLISPEILITHFEPMFTIL